MISLEVGTYGVNLPRLLSFCYSFVGLIMLLIDICNSLFLFTIAVEVYDR